MLQTKDIHNKTFKLKSEWIVPELNVGDKIEIVDEYSIRGTRFLILYGVEEHIPLYEFRAAYRTGVISETNS